MSKFKKFLFWLVIFIASLLFILVISGSGKYNRTRAAFHFIPLIKYKLCY